MWKSVRSGLSVLCLVAIGCSQSAGTNPQATPDAGGSGSGGSTVNGLGGSAGESAGSGGDQGATGGVGGMAASGTGRRGHS